MTTIASYTKQPAERKDYDVFYDEWLSWDPDDTLDDVQAHVLQMSGPTEGVPLFVERIDITATVAKLWVSGGTNGARYKVEITTSTQRGRIDQSEIKFTIKET